MKKKKGILYNLKAFNFNLIIIEKLKTTTTEKIRNKNNLFS